MPRRRRKPKLPENPVEAQIESLSHDGRGIAHIDGKTVFIGGALAGEKVLFRYTDRRNRYDEGDCLEVLENSSADRLEPGCPHFGLCGGCSLQHLRPEAQRALKQATLLEQFQHIGQVKPESVLEPLIGPTWGYRRKARLGAKFVIKKASLLVGFREKRSAFLADMHSCPVLHPSVGERIDELRELIGALASKEKIAQIEVAAGDNHTALVLRNLEPLSTADSERLSAYAQQHGLHLYLQPGGLDTVAPLWPQDAEELEYRLPDGLSLYFRPTDFTQVNADINRQMIPHALQLLNVQSDDEVLELFCGLGNFTLPLARQAQRVMAVEGEAGLIARAEENARRNGLDNIDYDVANLADTALERAWLQRSYPKILLDPPRSGALEIINKLDFSATRDLVYVSCNPATLARDAGELVKRHGFRLRQAGIMDMFPHTAHVESIAWFRR